MVRKLAHVEIDRFLLTAGIKNIARQRHGPYANGASALCGVAAHGGVSA